MRCSSCNTKIPKNAQFCPGCGKTIDVTGVQNYAGEAVTSKRTGLITGLIAAVVVLVICIGVLIFFLGHNNNGEKKDSNSVYLPIEESDDSYSETVEESSVAMVMESSIAETSDSTVTEESKIIATEELESSSAMEEFEVVKEITPSMAYDDILLEYFAICKMDPATYEEQAEFYPNTNHSIMKAYHEGQEASFYYSFYDLDQNGTDELLMGYGSDNSYVMLVDGYAFNGEEAVKIIEERMQGGLLETIIFEDGSYGVYGGSEGYSVYFYVRKLAEDGFSLDTIFDVSFDWTVNGEMDIEGIDVDNLTEEQYRYIEEGHEELDRELLNWQPLF